MHELSFSAVHLQCLPVLLPSSLHPGANQLASENNFHPKADVINCLQPLLGCLHLHGVKFTKQTY